ncbi:MAG: hypothetical protein WCX48_12105 [Bacteroidales bacterium]
MSLDLSELCGTAIAKLHISAFEFYDLVPVEFIHAIEVYNETCKNDIQTQYEVARWQTCHMYNMQGKIVKNCIQNVKDIEKFPWEQHVVQTMEDMKLKLLNSFSSFSFGKLKKKE